MYLCSRDLRSLHLSLPSSIPTTRNPFKPFHFKPFRFIEITTNIPPQVLTEKWTFMKDGDRKKFEKKKEFRNVEEFKKENEKYSKYDIKKFNNQFSEPATEKFLKNEVCV